MKNMKKSITYFFTVEGETEKWYLDWLQKQINECERKDAYKVKIDCQIQKNPLRRAKSLTITSKTILYHLSDYESSEDEHVKNFAETMENMDKVSKLGRQLKCKFGYSNFTFDLWIILHRMDCYGSYTHRSQYLDPINKAYEEKFQSIKEYKEEKNFRRLLSKLSLEDVKSAIKRAENIQKNNEENGYTLHKYKKYEYYKENPSLEVGTIIKTILEECKIL